MDRRKKGIRAPRILQLPMCYSENCKEDGYYFSVVMPEAYMTCCYLSQDRDFEEKKDYKKVTKRNFRRGKLEKAVYPRHKHTDVSFASINNERSRRGMV